MKPAIWGQFKWNDPNVRWNVTYEKGDPEYVEPPSTPSPSTPKPHRTKKMPKSDYLEPKDGPFVDQMITFKNAIGAYATLLGVTPAQVTAQAADANYMEYVLKCLDLMRNSGKQWTSWKDLVRDGGTPPATGMPMLPTLPTLCRRRPRHRGALPGAGQRPQRPSQLQRGHRPGPRRQRRPDLATLQPILKLEGSGGMINIR